MARQHPRFLFSNVTKGKSTGAFITHTLAPQLLLKITKEEVEQDELPSIFYTVGDITVFPVAIWAESGPTDDELYKTLQDAHRWLVSQLITGDISF